MKEQINLKEAMIEVYNDVQKRLATRLINKEYFAIKAIEFKKKSPEYKENINKSKEDEANIYWDKLTLRVIDEMIKKMK